ncbi:inositol monophosphatase family protein [Burkholderia plantarii]|uniref:Inositol-phosphate phosphatase n=1 Tax=Burkholderia plantarii TaxID=41899 RepID=A0A0B6RQG0_BURPL|nr:inositol monophosphatase family protein [Burkholderia plantarii]AJK45618.1 inositol-phosphate phosphatase [Burkholderia plantarii]
MTTINPKFPHGEAQQYIEAMLRPVHDAGKLAKRRFFTDVRVSELADFDCIVDEVNLACEKLIIKGIRCIDGSHPIHSAKSAVSGGTADWSWIVDPLDGTHNYLSAIPLFGVTLTLCHLDEPVAAILYDAYQDEMVHGIRNGPIFHNQVPLRELSTGQSLRHSTIGWMQGHAMRDDPLARQIREIVERHSKRLLATWSPVIDTIKIATGRFGGTVSFDGASTDVSAAQVIIPALGGKVVRFSRDGADRGFIIGASQHVAELSGHIQQAISG